MSNDIKQKQAKLVKARKAARMVFALIIFGGVILFLYGILTKYLPTVLEGVVMLVASLLPFVLSKGIEKKIARLQT